LYFPEAAQHQCITQAVAFLCPENIIFNHQLPAVVKGTSPVEKKTATGIRLARLKAQ
jgi:hypothetical protein